MPSRRSKDQLVRIILTICQGDGATKTRIIYDAGLNFNTVKSYLGLLIRKGLIEVVQGDLIRYKTTPRGEKALRCLKELEAIYS